tara:strand:+ start:75 stop:302 length:228 start_codon:yes stop_codon:yes gene_type:complete
MAKSKKKKAFLQEIVEEPEEITEESVDPEPQLLQEESEPEVSSKMTKQQYLDSIGMGHRPNSQRAIDAWESYQAS